MESFGCPDPGVGGQDMLNELDRIVSIMKRKYAKDIRVYDESFLLKVVGNRMNMTGAGTLGAYTEFLSENSLESEILFDTLNINYSEFFRNPLTFAMLEQRILPELIARKKDGGEIRIWSAGCASGQEAYSIAMLMYKLNSSQAKKCRFTVFATDKSRLFLEIARKGSYSANALGNVRFRQMGEYFTKCGDTYTIIPEICENVYFSEYDLLDKSSANPPESIYGGFDMVFCCNLLFYYQLDSVRFIIDKIKRSLSANGYLVTGEAERTLISRSEGLRTVAHSAAIFIRKG